MAAYPERYALCEGVEDQAFFEELAIVLGLPECAVKTIGASGGAHGIDGLLTHLKSVVGITGFRENVNRLVLLADNEDNQANTFAAVVQAFKNANGAADSDKFYSEPKTPLKTVRGNPCAVTVVLQPTDATEGCLETLLWRYLARKYPAEAACVEELIACSGIEKPELGWTRAKRDKARLRAGIATIYKENPNCSTSHLWNSYGKRVAVADQLIPLNEPEFAAISKALQDALA